MEKQVFLIQSNGRRPAEHYTVVFEDRSHADEVTKFGYYRHEGWHEKKSDADFGLVKVGDYALHYCTGDVNDCPSQIRYIYEVTAVENIPEEDLESAVKAGG